MGAALVVSAMAAAPSGAHGQALEPRSYVNTPVGINFLLGGYGYTQGNLTFDAGSPITDAKVQTHSGVIAYVRSLDVWGLSGKFTAALPFADTSGSAKVAGRERDREVFGLADPIFRLSVNFFGAPALSLEEFKDYQQDVLVGATVEVTPPLGQYNPTKLLNIGTNRWSVKPEIGVSKALGPFTLEVIGGVRFFTANDDFLNGKTLEQDPIYSVQGHLIYQFQNHIWVALNSTYYTGGRTITNGDKSERLGNARLGLTVAIPVSRSNSIKLYGSTGVYTRTGTDYQAAGILWQFRWGGGL